MLMDRIMGAFTFRRSVYAEVEADQNFTSSAWLLAALAFFLNQAGANFGLLVNGKAIAWLLSTTGATVFQLIGFAAGVYVIVLVGKQVFKAQVDFGEMVRTLGLASVWQSLGALAFVSILFPSALACLLAPLNLAIWVLSVAASFLAAQEALDLETVQTVVTIVIGWLVMLMIAVIGGVILGLFGLAASGAVNLFN